MCVCGVPEWGWGVCGVPECCMMCSMELGCVWSGGAGAVWEWGWCVCVGLECGVE